MRKLFVIIFLLFAGYPCSAQGTFTAASCNETDVNAIINGPTHTAVSGDTIVIPAGSCTWSSGITISNVGIDITGTGTPNIGGGTFGAGTSNTTITESGSSVILSFTGLSFGQTAKVELLTLALTGAGGVAAVTASGTCTTSGCAQIRFDNINFTSTWGDCFAVDNVFGVIDHNTASAPSTAADFLTQISFDAWQGVGGFGDNSFATADTFGSSQSLYMENNQIAGYRLSENDVAPPGGAVGGGRWVCRFNHLTSMSGDGLCGAHGTAWGGRFRGMRQVEAYYNTVSGGVNDSLDGLLSGTGYYFSNTYSGTLNKITSLDIARFIQTSTPWNSCDGTQPWDKSPWDSTTPCLDQPGSGIGAGLENSTPVLVSAPGTPCTTAGQCWPNPALDPVYEAGETAGNAAPGIVVATDGSSTRLLANRDYYAEVSQSAQSSATSPFNGTTGTGYGTLANRPTTCTPSVGYWATDAGTWNSFDNTKEGTLYICTSTNTWTSSYTPYTYPHPLDAGGNGNSNPHAPARRGMIFARLVDPAWVAERTEYQGEKR